MNNPKTEEIVEALRCRAHGDDCTEECLCYSNKDFDCVSNFTVLTTAADLIEQLQQELIDERYRHDRLQDFCVAQGEELSELKEQQRWIPVTERLPEDDDSVRFHKCFSTIFTSVLAYEKERGVSIANRLMIGRSGIKSLDELATDGYVWSTGCNPTHWMPLPEPPKE